MWTNHNGMVTEEYITPYREHYYHIFRFTYDGMLYSVVSDVDKDRNLTLVDGKKQLWDFVRDMLEWYPTLTDEQIELIMRDSVYMKLLARVPIFYPVWEYLQSRSDSTKHYLERCLKKVK